MAIKLKRFSNDELGSNLKKAIDKFNELLDSAGSPKKLVDGDIKVPNSIKGCIDLAKLAVSDPKDILALALIIRSRVMNGATIGEYFANHLVKGEVQFPWNSEPVLVFDDSTKLKQLRTIKRDTINKYKKYLNF